MDEYEPNLPPAQNPPPRNPPIQNDPPRYTLADVIPEFVINYPLPPPRRRRVWLPLLLFIATCASTWAAGTLFSDQAPEGNWPGVLRENWWPAIAEGLMYSGAVMTILLCHEMGHFLQALRYGVRASLPFFIPVPLPPIGTFGAVILMEPRQGDRKAVFDIGISGPLAGLVPTFLFLIVGLCLSHIAEAPPGDHFMLGTPLVMQYLINLIKGPLPHGFDLVLHPLAFAGWVGLLITSINLIPIGQLDGGHIVYGLWRKNAHVASMVVLMLAISASLALSLNNWWIMLGLIAFMGTRHPPTADDSVPLGAGRVRAGNPHAGLPAHWIHAQADELWALMAVRQAFQPDNWSGLGTMYAW